MIDVTKLCDVSHRGFDFTRRLKANLRKLEFVRWADHPNPKDAFL